MPIKIIRLFIPNLKIKEETVHMIVGKGQMNRGSSLVIVVALVALMMVIASEVLITAHAISNSLDTELDNTIENTFVESTYEVMRESFLSKVKESNDTNIYFPSTDVRDDMCVTTFSGFKLKAENIERDVDAKLYTYQDGKKHKCGIYEIAFNGHGDNGDVVKITYTIKTTFVISKTQCKTKSIDELKRKEG